MKSQNLWFVCLVWKSLSTNKMTACVFLHGLGTKSTQDLPISDRATGENFANHAQTETASVELL
jgi:hypothetical protein